MNCAETKLNNQKSPKIIHLMGTYSPSLQIQMIRHLKLPEDVVEVVGRILGRKGNFVMVKYTNIFVVDVEFTFL
jgi:hypothetical protein